jgi:biopolymer transport protein TolR
MAATRLGSTHRPLSEINVTPFVDVMLVLLIIFMVTAPMMQQGIDVDLPETTTQPLRVRDEPLILTVQKNGKYYLARKEIPEAELRAKLEAIFAGQDRKEIFLRADQDAAYKWVVKALAAAREAGATKLGMVTEPESQASGGR